MDPDELRAATDRWVEAGVVDRETADAIREFEREREADYPGRSRLVVALSVMGAVLVGAGLLAYLQSNWRSLSTATRTAILVAAPLTAGGAGLALARGRTPRVGHGLWFLGAAFLGPSLFSLADLHALHLEAEWLLLAWAVVALPAGHAFESRLTTALGLVVALAASAAAPTPDAGAFVVAFVGVAVVAAGLLVRRRSEPLAGVYRVVGLVPVAGSLLVLGARQGEYRGIDLGPDPVLVAAGVGAAAVVALVVAAWHREALSEPDALAVVAPGVAAGVGLGAVALVPPVPGVASFLLVHATLLGLLVAVVVVGVETASSALVNLVAVGFFLQVTTFLFTAVGDALSGAVALVVAGVILLAVGVGLERGRRRILDRMGI